MADAGATFLQSLAPTATAFAKADPADASKFGALITQISTNYPQLAPYMTDPAIATILLEGAAKNQTPAQLQGALQTSDWYRSKPPSERQWIVTKLVDPGRAAQLEAQTSVQVRQLASSFGVPLNSNQIDLFTQGALQGGWNAAEIQRQLVDYGRNVRLGPGQVTATQDGLRSTAASYAIPVSDHTLRNWATQINDGRQTTQGFEDYARGQAKLAFPSLAKQIDSGLTVKQIADPYGQIASQTLGIDAATIDWRAPKWQKALQSTDAKGDIIGPATHLAWQKTLMTDPTYGYSHTANGQASAYQLVNALAQGMGQQVV